MKNIFEVSLKSVQALSPTVKHFVFNMPQDKEWSFTAGQFMCIHIEHDGKSLRRNYSIANSPVQKDTFEIACTYVKDGLASELLFNLKEGESIPVSMPYGIFTLKEPIEGHYYLIATGTGVTPYRAMLPELMEKMKQQKIKVTLLFGARTREEALYQDEFLKVMNEYEEFQYYCCYSREKTSDLQPYEQKGYVQGKLSECVLDPKRDKVYLCGNPQMVDDVFAYLLDNQFERKQVIREKYISGQR